MPDRVTLGGVALLCFPPYDRVFAALADRQLAQLPERTPATLQAALRQAYPRATVRERHALAAFHPDEAWYVYRDGRYGPHASEHRWWESPEAAWVVIDEFGAYVDANEPALALLDMSRAELLELRTGDLADPAVAELVPWIWDLAREAREIHSTSILRPRGSRPRIGVEYRLVVGIDGTGRSRSHLRPIPLADAEPSPEPRTAE